MERYIIADIHGELDKLKVLISKILGINTNTVILELIFLGDYVDRGPDSCGVINYLIELSKKIKCIFIMGNHDDEFLQYIQFGDKVYYQHPFYRYGFKETVDSYIKLDLPLNTHENFLKMCIPYYIFMDKNGKHIATHGGFDPYRFVENTPNSIFQWDRLLLNEAVHKCKEFESYQDRFTSTIDKFDYIYLGHTCVQDYGFNSPQLYGNVWALDTGVGKFPGSTLYSLHVNSQILLN